MTFRTHCYPLTIASAMSALVASTTINVGARAPQTPPAPSKFVASAVLEPLLPSPAGWTRTRTGGSQVVASDSCVYSFADATYANGDMRVRITIADTGQNEESLSFLATIVVSFPDGYAGVVPPATSIARLSLNGTPAGSRWDAEQRDGEFTALVGRRFVAKAEGTGIDNIATLRAMVELIDLKKLGELK